MKINANPFYHFAKSKTGQKLYSKVTKPEMDNFFNNSMPVLETGICTLAYCYATHHDKKIPEERKPVLQWQNVINGVIGMVISARLNQWVSKKADLIVEQLDPKKVEDLHKVVGGLKIGLPILVTGLVMRYGISTMTVPLSMLIEKVKGRFVKKDK